MYVELSYELQESIPIIPYFLMSVFHCCLVNFLNNGCPCPKTSTYNMQCLILKESSKIAAHDTFFFSRQQRFFLFIDSCNTWHFNIYEQKKFNAQLSMKSFITSRPCLTVSFPSCPGKWLLFTNQKTTAASHK